MSVELDARNFFVAVVLYLVVVSVTTYFDAKLGYWLQQILMVVPIYYITVLALESELHGDAIESD